MGDLLSDLNARPMEVSLHGADGWVHEVSCVCVLMGSLHGADGWVHEVSCVCLEGEGEGPMRAHMPPSLRHSLAPLNPPPSSPQPATAARAGHLCGRHLHPLQHRGGAEGGCTALPRLAAAGDGAQPGG